jgi:uncharacterized protein YcaQ
MSRRVRLSAAEARRIALAAQSMHRERPACAPDARHFRRAMQALQVLQLDFVNVLVPAHYLVLWSRLGAYDRQRFDRFVYDEGNYIEQWAHEASIVPSDAWPLLAHRRAAHAPSKHNPLHRLRNRKAYLDTVLDQVRRDGALTAADLPPLPGPTRKPAATSPCPGACAIFSGYTISRSGSSRDVRSPRRTTGRQRIARCCAAPHWHWA